MVISPEILVMGSDMEFDGNIVVEETQNYEENSKILSFIMKGIVSVNKFRKEYLHLQVGNFCDTLFRKKSLLHKMLWQFVTDILLRNVTLITEITESKVCQPLYRELEPLDGVVHIYILMW